MNRKLIFITFYLGLFFFAFNSFEGLKFLGEFKNEAGAYFIVFGFFLMFFEKKFYFPINSPIFKLIILFFVWCFITTILNTSGVLNSYLKHTTGINRFIRQYISLFLSTIVFFLFFYNVIKKMSLEDIFLKVRRVFLITLIFAFILGFFETLYTVFGIGKAKSIIELLNYFPFVEKDIFLDRISSIGNEPPDLALFLISTCSWMLSYIYTEKSIGKYLPTIMILFLTYYSGSRTALIVIFIQLSIFLYIITPKQQFFLIVQKGVLIIFSLSLILVIFESDKVLKSVENKIESLNFKKNLTKNISNQSRFGIQYASLQVFKDNPIIGVGYGQQSFYSRNYYPGWAKKRNYEFKELYENSAVKSFPPAYNIYTRVLAETGIVGFCILLYFIIYVLYSLNKHLRIHNKDNFVLILILYTTLFGLFLYWLQNDTFKIYVLWLSIAIFIKIKQEKIIKNHDTEKNSK